MRPKPCCAKRARTKPLSLARCQSRHDVPHVTHRGSSKLSSANRKKFGLPVAPLDGYPTFFHALSTAFTLWTYARMRLCSGMNVQRCGENMRSFPHASQAKNCHSIQAQSSHQSASIALLSVPIGRITGRVALEMIRWIVYHTPHSAGSVRADNSLIPQISLRE